MILTFFRFQLLFLQNQNHWLDFHQQDLNCWFFVRLLHSFSFELVSCVAILTVREFQNYSQFCQIFSFKLMYLHNYRLEKFHQRSQWKRLYSCRKKWEKTLSTQILNWNLGIEIARSSYILIIGTQLDFQKHFSPKTCLKSFFHGLNL